jgi:hypothetical protein
MTEEQRKTAAQWLVDFYSAVTQGKTVQVEGASGEWIDCHTVDYWPGIGSALNSKHEWRIKPEPRRMWMGLRGATYEEEAAAKWKAEGLTVTEWVEVI